MTNEQQWLARKYITYRTLINMWFVGAIWLYFYRLFITDQQVGILDGLAFAIGLLAEVPSGALADKFGRDRTVKLGQLLSGSGFLIQSVCLCHWRLDIFNRATYTLGAKWYCFYK